MIPVRGYSGHKVAVLGLGRSGRPTVAALLAGGAEVVAWDDGAAARAAAEADGIPLDDLTKAKAWDGAKALIVSPGIPHLYPAPHPAIRAAWDAGVAVDNDIGLFFRSFATPAWQEFDRMPSVVCVTGSNGKSTTTALAAHLLAATGRPVQVGGNIGRGALDLDPAEDGMVVILELSSYQIELARALQPDIAVFLNLSPDHLDRHGGIGGYFAAKRRLFAEGGPSRSIIGVDEDEGRFLANAMREEAGTGDPVIEISSGRKLDRLGWSVFARKGFLAEWRHGRQQASIDLRAMATLPGAHNHQNACAAYAVARVLGIGPRQIEASLATYPGLPHRSQIVGEWGGVRVVNDSKATNADAASRSLGSFERVRWIAGGRPKEGGIEALRELFPRVAKAYLIGEAAGGFAATLGEVPYSVAGTLDAAVTAALTEAEPGDTVLLAPACSSFDQFASFEERGERFEALVRERLAG
ncbi:UDP-N-acetylmuramoylalanine--D-glutamate ligase [Amaricoccus macauensis]|uniref:UDP-N-acetylmuramoylalanine--D-glutamate ligase n=1 Tax=Amaricoccus macauensis TaxID=57001 RepID=A0A840ST78_9RHOB|nr:UDP-N-acetylmuramoyl-L-alanine--D-glutamate ligase [Amaricoccus macauensis]MBB5223808.1 UDP-N-acetylmuramoylalanine--D-glutamate ligase [Amaricoccus macauensis]